MRTSQAGRRSAEAPFPASLGLGIAGSLQNRAFMRASATTNGHGLAGDATSTIAFVQLVCKTSGFFSWSAGFSVPTAAATEVVTASALVGFGTGVVATTGATAVASTAGFAVTGGQAAVNTAAAGSSIIFTTGAAGGVAVTLGTDSKTIGTAAVGYDFSGGGLLYNFATGLGYTVGQNVILMLQVTNSATNRVCSGIVLSLQEQP